MPPVLGKKLLGLPRWAWIAILVGGGTVGLILRQRQQAAATDTTATDAAATAGDYTDPTGQADTGYVPDTSSYDSGMTLSPAAEGGYFQWPTQPSAVEPTQPVPVEITVGPIGDQASGHGKINKKGQRGPQGPRGPKGGKGGKGGSPGKGKSKKQHHNRARANSSMTGGGPPSRRAAHEGPRPKARKK